MNLCGGDEEKFLLRWSGLSGAERRAMRRKLLAVAVFAAGALTAVSGAAWALMPYPFENQSDVPDGWAAPFVGNWSATVAGQTGKTIATCAIPFEIEAIGRRRIVYRNPNDPAAEVDLVAEDHRTTWRSGIEGGGFLAVWINKDNFYLYDQEQPDLGGPYSFTRCD